jgi:hypothetical protein
LADAAHLIKQQCVGAVVGRSYKEEQAGADQPMADHLQHRAAAPQNTEAADANQHKSHMADGAIGDFPFEIALGEGCESGVNNVDHP